jgi:hypothetical protein
MKKLAIRMVAALAFIAAALPASTAGLPWIQDNYSKALAEAKQRKLPIFVEVWAPW